MIARVHLSNGVAIAAVLAINVAWAPAQSDEPVGYVTVLTGAGAARLDSGGPVQLDRLEFLPEENGLELGEGVATAPQGTAVVVMARYGATAYLQSDSRLNLREAPAQASRVDLVLQLSEGRASVVRKASAAGAVVVAGESDAAAGYVILRAGSIVVTALGATVTFAVEHGTATFFPGSVPDAAMIDPSGKPLDASGLTLHAGQGITTQAPTEVTPYDAESVATVSAEMHNDMYAFGIEQSTQWVKRAEQGDFTPVRAGRGRAAVELVGTDFAPSQAFDQPQQLLAATAPLGRPVAVTRAVISPAQSLVESGIPGSVIAGQRFRRSRIVGNPGTGALIVNPSAEVLIRIAGQ